MYFISILFELYLIVLIVRLLLEWFGANSRNSFCRLIIKLSQLLIKPVQNILPIRGNFNWACFGVIVLIKVIELLILFWLQIHTWPHMGGLAIVALGQLLNLTLNILFWAIILQAILSWIAAINRTYNPLHEVLYTLTIPLLRPAQRLIPPLGGIDISSIPVLILLKLIIAYLISPIIGVGFGLIF